jgi:hypothetical protein
MATGYKYWLSRLLNRIGSRPVASRRGRRLPRQRARASQSGFTISAMVEGLESRQLLSGPTVNIGADFQANYNVKLDTTTRAPFGAGDFDTTTITLPGGGSAVSLPFAYCVDIPSGILNNTNYNAAVNSTNFAAPSGGYIQDPHNPVVASINTNAIAWLAANIGPTIGNPQLSGPVNNPGSNYAAGMALQVALWQAEYEAPGSGLGE